MLSDTVIGIMFFKTAEMPPITKIADDKNYAESQNGGHEPEVHITLVSSVVYVIATKF